MLLPFLNLFLHPLRFFQRLHNLLRLHLFLGLDAVNYPLPGSVYVLHVLLILPLLFKFQRQSLLLLDFVDGLPLLVEQPIPPLLILFELIDILDDLHIHLSGTDQKQLIMLSLYQTHLFAKMKTLHHQIQEHEIPV